MFEAIFDKQKRQINIDSVSEFSLVVGLMTIEELNECYALLGFSDETVRDCEADVTHFSTNIEVHDTYSFGMLNVINVMDVNLPREKVAFYIKKNLFLIIKDKEEAPQTQNLYDKAIEHLVEGVTLERVVFSALECLLAHGSSSLELTEETIMKLEKRMINGRKNKELNKVIFELKWHLMLQKNYYSQIIEIGQELEENENRIFSGRNLRYFRMLTERAERLNEGIRSLGESLIHLREALDASLEYELNSIMKMFTVVTTIFLPLTLIVGWYGMNFKNMPELTWKYGYLCVAVLSILVIVGCIIMFKRKKLI